MDSKEGVRYTKVDALPPVTTPSGTSGEGATGRDWNTRPHMSFELLDYILNEFIGFSKYHYQTICLCILNLFALQCEYLINIYMQDEVCAGLLEDRPGESPEQKRDACYASYTKLMLVVCLAYICACTLWSNLIDSAGRRLFFKYLSIPLAIVSVATAFVNSFDLFIFFRALVSFFSLGVTIVDRVYLIEILPIGVRGLATLIVAAFGVAGRVYFAGICWGLIHTFGWRVVILIASLPVAVNAIVRLAIRCNESPRYLMVNGRQNEAWTAVTWMYFLEKCSAAQLLFFSFISGDGSITYRTEGKMLRSLTDSVRQRLGAKSYTSFSCPSPQFPPAVFVPNRLYDHLYAEKPRVSARLAGIYKGVTEQISQIQYQRLFQEIKTKEGMETAGEPLLYAEMLESPSVFGDKDFASNIRRKEGTPLHEYDGLGLYAEADTPKPGTSCYGDLSSSVIWSRNGQFEGDYPTARSPSMKLRVTPPSHDDLFSDPSTSPSEVHHVERRNTTPLPDKTARRSIRGFFVAVGKAFARTAILFNPFFRRRTIILLAMRVLYTTGYTGFASMLLFYVDLSELPRYSFLFFTVVAAVVGVLLASYLIEKMNGSQICGRIRIIQVFSLIACISLGLVTVVQFAKTEPGQLKLIKNAIYSNISHWVDEIKSLTHGVAPEYTFNFLQLETTPSVSDNIEGNYCSWPAQFSFLVGSALHASATGLPAYPLKTARVQRKSGVVKNVFMSLNVEPELFKAKESHFLDLSAEKVVSPSFFEEVHNTGNDNSRSGLGHDKVEAVPLSSEDANLPIPAEVSLPSLPENSESDGEPVFHPTTEKIVVMALLIIFSCFGGATLSVLFLYTSENYPTELRATSEGLIAQVAALTWPLDLVIGSYMLERSAKHALWLYPLAFLIPYIILCLIALQLNIKTGGCQMTEFDEASSPQNVKL